MKARLDGKVDRLRSQTMQFTSDGIQVTLNVPDTNDVKETFGTVITTVVEQQEEIEEITHNIDIIVDDTDKNQQEILLWTKHLMKELQNENIKLKKSVEASNYQLKNLSYNIQGYLDDTNTATNIDGSCSNIDIALPKLKKYKEKENNDALFSTEAGAIVTSTTLGFNPLTNNNHSNNILNDNTMILNTNQHQLNKKLKTIEEKQHAKEYYQSISCNIFPTNNKQRWRWIIKKILSNIRIKKLKLGFTQQRFEYKQTFACKLDRLNDDVYEQHKELTLKIKKESVKYQQLLDESINNVQTNINNVQTNVDSLATTTTDHFNIVHKEINELNDNMIAFFTKLQEKADNEAKELKDSLLFINNHLKNMLNIDYNYLISKTNHINSNIHNIDISADGLYQNLQKIQVLVLTLNPPSASNHSFVNTNPLQDLTELSEVLQIDMTLRRLRVELNALDRSLQTTKKDFMVCNEHLIKKYEYYTNLYNIQKNQDKDNNNKDSDNMNVQRLITEEQMLGFAKVLDEYNNIIPNELVRLQDMIVAMLQICYDHDVQLQERYKVLAIVSEKMNYLLKVTSNFDDMKDKLDYLQTIVINNEREQTDTFIAYDEHLLELTSRLGLMENLILDVEGKINANQNEIFKTIEQKNKEKELLLKEEQEKYLLARSEANKATRSSMVVVNNHNHTTSNNNSNNNSTDNNNNIINNNIVQSIVTQPQVDKCNSINEINTEDHEILIDNTDNSTNNNTTTNNNNKEKEEMQDIDINNSSNMNNIDMSLSPMKPVYLAKERSIKLKASFSTAIALETLENKLKPMFNQLIMDKLSSQQVIPSGGSMVQNEIKQYESSPSKDAIKKNKQISEDLEILTKELKKENNKLIKQIELLKSEKVEKKDMEELFLQFYQQQKLLENKSDQAQIIDDIERRNQEIVREMISLRHDHEHEVKQLKNHFSNTLLDVINNTANKMEEENKDAFLNTRAFCLSCGRDGRVQKHPEVLSQSEQFFPQLNRPITPGPDIYRAGFRSPIKNNLDVNSILEGGSSSILNSPTRRIKSAGQHMLHTISMMNSSATMNNNTSNNNNIFESIHRLDSISQPSMNTTSSNKSQLRHNAATKLPIVSDDCDSSQNTHYDPHAVDDNAADHNNNMDGPSDYQFLFASDSFLEPTSIQDSLAIDLNNIISNNMNTQDEQSMIEANSILNIESTTVPIRATSAMKTVRYGQGKPEAEELRSFYRKGLPGKKSLRAEVAYAPERYDLVGDKNLILKNSSMNINQRRPNSSSVISDNDYKKNINKNLLRINNNVMINSESLPKIV